MPIQVVNLDNFSYFQNSEVLAKLNKHLALHDDFMLHQIASATGCTLDDAMRVLLYLYHLKLVQVYLVVYTVDDPESPILIRDFQQGYPDIPFQNPVTEEWVDSYQQLSFEFLFRLLQPDITIIFETNYDTNNR